MEDTGMSDPNFGDDFAPCCGCSNEQPTAMLCGCDNDDTGPLCPECHDDEHEGMAVA